MHSKLQCITENLQHSNSYVFQILGNCDTLMSQKNVAY